MEYAKLTQPDKTRHFISVDFDTFFEFQRAPDLKEQRVWQEMYLSREGLERWERARADRKTLTELGAEIANL